ncbi:MAG: SUMF1/EgtB/PvdO family nonheme iron enzyme [Rubripirellula sp.]
MSDADFDPYHKWLSIPPAEQPANYYRLLGVELFNSDPDIIDLAAQRQMSFVRTFALGEHGERAQSLLNELAKARAILLDPESKAKYDAWLNAQQRQPAAVPSPPDASANVGPSVQLNIPTAPVAPRKTSRPKKRRQQPSKLIPSVAGFVGVLLVGSLLAWLLSGPEQPVVAELTANDPPSRDRQGSEERDEVQPIQPPGGLGSILDSAKPSSGGVAEEVAEETPGPMEPDVQPEKTSPPEPEEPTAETIVVSSEQSDANNTPAPAVAPFDSDQAKSYQEAWAEHLGLDVDVTNSIGMKLRVIPPGTFTMGEGNDAHEVTITKPFMLGVHEVTQADYQTVMRTNPSKFKGARNPVEEINWNDATEFCRRLSLLPREKRAGRVYRLPTEAEWDYARRAGTTTTYSFGEDESLLSRYGWFNKNSGGTTHPVGSKLANPFGLYDMHGNVWESCQDWYGDYPNFAVIDPKGDISGSRRVYRGGSWYSPAVFCRSAYRTGSNPSYRSSFYGFRVTCVPSGNPVAEVAASPDMNSGRNVEPDAIASPPIAAPVNDGPEPAIAPFDAAEAKVHQGRWARHLRKRVEVTNSIGMKLRVIPPGTFMMGSEALDREKPIHEVTLTKPFMIGVHEVTQADYQQVMGVNPSQFKGVRNPVEKVSWNDATEFCRRLSLLPREKLARRVYRLPTEAEWEFACRAGTTTMYSFGDAESLLNRYGWTKDNGGRATHPVGSKLANPFGLYDMHGNVWEWCSDRYGDYPSDAVTDPAGVSSGLGRVLRGGSWFNTAGDCWSANRFRFDPSYRNNCGGFRVTCVPSGQSSE